MLAMRRWRLAAVLLFSAAAFGARAQGIAAQREVTAVPGRDVRVSVFANVQSDCTSGPLPAIKLTTPPAHGAVTVKRGTFKATNFKQCLATEVPVYVAFYRAAADFSGTDTFDLEVTLPGGRKQIQHVRVNVSNNAGGQKGI